MIAGNANAAQPRHRPKYFICIIICIYFCGILLALGCNGVGLALVAFSAL